MPQRKQVKNPYYFFMLEKIPELRQKGIKVNGLRDAAPLCSSEWQLLNEDEKEKFTQLAQQWKAEKDHKIVNKSEKKEQLKNPVYSAAREMSNPPMNWFSDEDACDEIFHFISFLSLADLPSNCEQRFLPCEMACVEYSMKKGIIDEFHCFIDPGMIPCGFRYHCQISSALVRHCQSESQATGKYAYPLAECFRVNWCLNWLAHKAGGSSIPINVFVLEELVVKLYEHKLKEKPSKASVEKMLSVMVWDYAANTRCEWHDEHDVVHCALATTKKYAYCISDSLVSVYEFDITAAHIPKKESTYGTVLNPKVLVLDSYYQQTKPTENLTRRYFHSSPEATISNISNAVRLGGWTLRRSTETSQKTYRTCVRLCHSQQEDGSGVET
ncbi:protein maelstrom homolog isoform X3 [Narcine bancroftii]|uniref:protein maelstrom homolog isoform X3 n=1 Tax=Narcine bancroftii TaxID=1343680 RepID=UPI00383227D7